MLYVAAMPGAANPHEAAWQLLFSMLSAAKPDLKTEEILKIYSDHLELEYKAKKSQFYEFLTIYFPSLYALDEIKEKINPLRLVKP